MPHKAPGKAFRKGMSLIQLFEMFPDNATAERWFIEMRWPDGVRCPKCGSDDIHVESHRTAPYRCHSCRNAKVRGGGKFSVKNGTVMESSKLGYRKWAIAIYLFNTSLKGVSSMKLHRDLGISQKSAWHMAHRLREAWKPEWTAFNGPVEVDETYVGGKEKNKHASKKLKAGRGPVGKAAVIGIKDRDTNRVSALRINNTDEHTLYNFVGGLIEPGAAIYTDEHAGYRNLPNHRTVKHLVGEYVDGQAHTNGIESFWALLKRGYHGTYHKMSRKHLDRYVQEFAARHNVREEDTVAQMAALARGMSGKRLRFNDLIAPVDLPALKQGGSDVF